MSVWRGVSQPGTFAVRVDGGFGAVLDRGPGADVPGDTAGWTPSASKRATACLQLISTGQVQTASIPTMRSDGDRRTMTVTP